MKNNKLLRNILFGVLIVILALLLLLQVGVTILYLDYFTHSKMMFHIPGLLDHFVPQGFAYIQDTESFLMSGYMSDDTASRVYVRDGDGKTRFTLLLNADGTPYMQHAGGICTNGKYAYLPGDTGVDVFDLDEILAGSEAKLVSTIDLGHRTDFCSYQNGYLFVGNFYYADHYDTPAHHHVTTPAGDANTGVITVFKGDDAADFGISPEPVAAFSTREKVQGMCMTDDEQIVLSTSWGLSTSVLYCYDLDTQRKGTMQTNRGEVPL